MKPLYDCLAVPTVAALLLVATSGRGIADSSTNDIGTQQVPHYVIIDDIRKHLETLQKEGGYVSLRGIVCSSSEHYQQWLSANGGKQVSYPRNNQCWENKESDNRKATGRCKELSGYLASTPDRSFPLPVCEFHDSHSAKPIWAALRNVRTIRIPGK